MLAPRHDLTPGSSVGAELVGDQAAWRAALLLQQTFQQAAGRFGVAPHLDDFVEDIAVLIDGPPQPVLLARDRDHDLIQMPDVTVAWRLAPEAAGVSRAELQGPSSDGLIGTTMPRSSSISSTSRRLRGKRKYNQTA